MTRGYPRLTLGLIAPFLIIVAGCQSGASDASGDARQVRVAAAANLKFAFDELAGDFQSQNPGINIVVTYGSSGNFFAQLSNKAPFDVFLSADTDYPRKLIEKGLATKESEFIYAIGQLVTWVPNSSKLDLEKDGLEGLVDPAVRKIAIANPIHAPYGRAAETVLKKQGVFEKVKERLVFGDNIEQAAHFVHSGAADAGILSLSLVLAPTFKNKGRYWIIPQDLYPPLEQAGIVTSWTKEKDGSDKLRAYLLGEQGRRILERHGYKLPSKRG